MTIVHGPGARWDVIGLLEGIAGLAAAPPSGCGCAADALRAFAQAWDEGRAMPMYDATRCALDQQAGRDR